MTKELEREAGEYADEHAFRVPYDGSNKFYDDVDFKASKEGYLAGAEPREKQIQALQKQNGELTDKVKELEARFEKLINFASSKIECCDVCPITDTCINSEGTCPYAVILAMGEEGVTREWLMQFISRR